MKSAQRGGGFIDSASGAKIPTRAVVLRVAVNNTDLPGRTDGTIVTHRKGKCGCDYVNF